MQTPLLFSRRWRLPAGQLQRRSRTMVLAGQWLIAALLLGLGLAAYE